jgi:hypothetical protein
MRAASRLWFDSIVWDDNFPDGKVLSAQNGFFKTSAVGTVAFLLYYVEDLVAFVAFGQARNDIDEAGKSSRPLDF